MHHLIYLSAATELFDRDQLQDLLSESRRRNTQKGITGVLVYNDGSFLQAIEGEESKVRDLFQRISADPRHRKITTLFDEPIQTRDFGSWSMAFHDVSQIPDAAEGFNTLMNQQDRVELAEQYPAKVRAFLRHLVR
jgi:hypothetical protein